MNDPSLPGESSGISSNGDGKDPAAFRTIGEVASALGIRQHVLRYWEEQFPTLRPLTRAGGRRYYRPEDVALIGEIDRLLNREGYTIKGARQALRGTKPGPAPVLGPAPAPYPASAIAAGGEGSDLWLAAQIQAIRDRLATALGDQPG
ncbi:MerR family transcriptional regulator [Novosphingobium sp. CECT 9465]|uniref:MerR family transcriptional regulator n=1 Tax=Novosphingobium sp. CECT 9465 TaxID=2829794 RepID=UPI001E388A28|nr:MerR family transcriptional regulator [Novosphingobium sp. CECT 9465]CAH0497099.1 hypothetical protein NVSP9465_02151 [Novosphingobium sp. CECT 9465]